MKQQLSILILCLPFLLYSQSSAKIKWGKIPQSDLDMQVYEKDSSATAVVLNDKTVGEIYVFKDRSFFDIKRHYRIKILQSEGYEYGNIEIPIYSYKKEEQLKHIKGQVIHPDGSKYKLEKENINKTKRNKYYTDTYINFPKLVPGCIIELQYNIETEDFFSIRPWYFQREIPVKDATLNMKIPEVLKYIILANNEEQLKYTDNLCYVNDVPGMKEEEFITTMDDYMGRVQYQLKEINNRPYFSTWQKVCEELTESKYFGQQIKAKKIKSLITEARPILDNANTMEVEELVNSLANVVYENLKWNGDYNIYVNEDLKKCLEAKEGNSAALNLAFLALLRESGRVAYPFIVSTRNHGKLYPFYPFLSQFNHTMVFMKHDNKQYMIDLSDRSKFALLPRANSLNGTGLVVYSENAEIVTTPIYKSTSFVKTNLKIEGEDIVGSASCSFKNHLSIKERKKHLEDKAKEKWEAALSSDISKATVTNLNSDNLEENSAKFAESFDLKISGKVEMLDDLLLVTNDLFLPFKTNPFSAKERNFQIDLTYPRKYIVISEYVIPKGYALESIPEPLVASLPSNKMSCKIIYTQKGDVINCVRELNFKSPVFDVIEYQPIRGIFDLIFQNIEEPIVFKKL